jgi:hypothetical protein
LDFFEIDPPRDKRRDARWDDREKMIAVSLTTQEKGDEGWRRKQRKKKAHLRWSTGVNVNVPIVTSAHERCTSWKCHMPKWKDRKAERKGGVK